MDKPLISIIIPIHNSERYLNVCLDSIFQQNWKPLEVILIDDGSEDASRNIIAKYQEKHSNIIALFQESSGVSKARNRGLEAATGSYIAFCDSDDFLSPNMISTLVHGLEQEEASLSCCRFTEFAENESPTFSSGGEIQTLWGVEMYNAVVHRELCGGYVWNKLFRRSLIEQTPALRFREQLSILEDELFVLEYLQRSQNMNMTFDHLYGYRLHQDSILHGDFAPQMITAILGWEEIYKIVSQYANRQNLCAKVWNDLMLEYSVIYKKLIHHSVPDKKYWRRRIRYGYLKHKGMHALNDQWTPKEKIYLQFLALSAIVLERKEKDKHVKGAAN